ncbi:MAG: type II toxin-antitoxin system VapC family toxin, partial [Nitrososphaerales archaeon]
MAQAEILVLDASVAVKWYNPEPLRENAVAIRNGFRAGRISLVAPALIYYEVANALRYNPKFGIEEVKMALESLENLQLEM